jgi:hypothetical protein
MDFYINYAVVKNGVVVEYPVNPRVLLASTQEYNIPHNWEGGDLDGKTYVFCHDSKPYTDYTEVLIETTPYYDQTKQLWYRGYQKQTAPAELITMRRSSAAAIAQNSILSLLETYSNSRALELELSDKQKADWTQYCSVLQSIPNQSGYPMRIEWPEVPDSAATVMKLEVVRV